MEALSVKIKIGDREYPMKVKVEDEAKIRHAGKLINDKIKRYRDEFGLDDRQDLLAMVAFDSMVESMEQNKINTDDSELVESSIVRVNAQLKSLL
ncbi:cell division protein ZapA [Rhodonellum psychrophilum GCM71 = DSM 17998]|uniref:Cell division protein ZapA n=2 Tax=Rhodonellum TaxID=336827 RepID=U5BZ18_9BACT|nr:MULTISPECIES: cell division protein ZapA [Rhodonellum]ERM82814.1 cell division protein ZapA [Rhodonellum psychrophilum GCM71 = DSM 17998]MDO9551022.1 cell division protein ZapA [Rhodonellum sp.]